MTFTVGLFVGLFAGAGLALIGLAALTAGARADQWMAGYKQGAADGERLRGWEGAGAQPGAELRCNLCGALCDETSPDWRFSGSAWEHSHPYPVGHVVATYRESREDR